MGNFSRVQQISLICLVVSLAGLWSSVGWSQPGDAQIPQRDDGSMRGAIVGITATPIILASGFLGAAQQKFEWMSIASTGVTAGSGVMAAAIGQRARQLDAQSGSRPFRLVAWHLYGLCLGTGVVDFVARYRFGESPSPLSWLSPVAGALAVSLLSIDAVLTHQTVGREQQLRPKSPAPAAVLISPSVLLWRSELRAAVDGALVGINGRF